MHDMRRALVIGSVSLLGLGVASCVSPVDQKGSTVPPDCQVEAPLVAPQKTDILFVIDNSGSMAEEQAAVAAQLPAFVEELKKGAGAGHDFQVGVITTAVYQNAQVNGVINYVEFSEQAGRLQAVPIAEADGGTSPGTEKILKSDDPALVEKFARLVKQGTSGSGQETPFEAVRRAVATDLANTANAGFLRDDARLLVVVVSDEDDCSEIVAPGARPKVTVGTDPGRDYCSEQAAQLTRVSEYADLFKSLKDSQGKLRQVLWTAIAPVARSNKEAQAIVDNGQVRNVDCPTSQGPGYRHREMALDFNSSLENLASICSADYGTSLLAIAQIANFTQSIEVRNVPDPRLLKVEITRGDGEVVSCTLANGGITYDPPVAEGEPGTVIFTDLCTRKFDDKAVQLKLICAG